MKTQEKYNEMGFIKLSDAKVQDKYGNVYYPRKASSPLKAIKFFCRECMGMDRRNQRQVENVELVRDCVDPMCPLFDFRLGKNPFIKRILTEEQRKATAERLKLARGAQ
jgi:hypothetical protein